MQASEQEVKTICLPCETFQGRYAGSNLVKIVLSFTETGSTL